MRCDSTCIRSKTSNVLLGVIIAKGLFLSPPLVDRGFRITNLKITTLKMSLWLKPESCNFLRFLLPLNYPVELPWFIN